MVGPITDGNNLALFSFFAASTYNKAPEVQHSNIANYLIYRFA